jgi:hypothetical protein
MCHPDLHNIVDDPEFERELKYVEKISSYLYIVSLLIIGVSIGINLFS